MSGNCHLYLKEKPVDSALTVKDIREAADCLKPDEEYIPIEITDPLSASSAMGFISVSLDQVVSGRTSQLRSLAKEKLFATDSRDGDEFEGELAGMKYRLCR